MEPGVLTRNVSGGRNEENRPPHIDYVDRRGTRHAACRQRTGLADPTRVSFGTTALGSFTHFFGVMAGKAVGIPLGPVPYRGAAPLVADLQGGHIGGLTYSAPCRYAIRDTCTPTAERSALT